MEDSNESLLQLLKEKSNILNAKCQQFQADIKCITDKIMSSEINNENKSKYNNKINKLCDDYSTSINRLEIEYLIKCETYLQPTNNNSSSTDMENSTTKQKTYTCFDCNISYTAKSSLLRHNKKNHKKSQENESSSSSNSETETQHKCNKCDKICSSIYCLRKHTKKAHSLNPVQCNICFKMFGSKQALGGHKSSAHRKKQNRPFKCFQCTSDFAQKRYLRQHIIKVHNGNPWQCDECNQAFRLKKKLMQHKQITHANNTSEFSSDDEFECNECDEKFANRMELNRHRNTVHVIINVNPYKCDICCKCFGSVTGLKVHKLTHNQEKTFKCVVKDCGSTFKLKRYLTRHVRNVHKQDPWKCDYKQCEQTFNKKPDMVKHQKIMHGLVSNNKKELNESSESEKISVVNDEESVKSKSNSNSLEGITVYKRTKSLFNHRL